MEGISTTSREVCEEPTSSPIESGLIRRVIEDLEELTSSKMKHELRIDHKVIVQSKRTRVILPILCKLLTKSDKHSIQPSKNIRTIINLRLKHCDPSH